MNNNQRPNQASGGLRIEKKLEGNNQGNQNKKSKKEQKRISGPSFLLPYNQEWLVYVYKKKTLVVSVLLCHILCLIIL